MRIILILLTLVFSSTLFSQDPSDKLQIEATLNHYIDGFYKGDTTALKKALKPRLYKFGYWKNKATGTYEYYAKMNYNDAMAFVQKMKDEGRTRDENEIRNVEVLDIGNHIATGKVTAVWGIDYMTLSKDNGQWQIEQVIWEGPYERAFVQNTTTYYLIRHAEKNRSDSSNQDPHLTINGKRRANNWAKTFTNVAFDEVYSTNYSRTMETALPTANAKKLDIINYHPWKMDLQKFKEDTNGKTILVVGHSNTIPKLANQLLEEDKYEDIKDDNNSNLYVITISKDSKTAQLLSIN